MNEFPTIPGFNIERELGQGGMARVFLAYQEKLERYVALKVLKSSMSEIPDATARFLKEAKTSAKLVHPNIITVYDAGRYGDHSYMVMELLEGGNLLDRLPRNGAGGMEPRAALLIVRKIALALAHAHRHGTIHRDIKPENVMFRTDGTPVLVDFGIARATDSSTQYTQLGTSIGTPWYMSPEQVRGEPVDARSDLYSLGVMLFQLLSGKVPYDAPDPIAVAVKHLHDPVPRLPETLLRYQPLVDALMSRDRERRVQSGDILVTMVDSYLDETRRPAARPPVPPPPPPATGAPKEETGRTAVRPLPWDQPVRRTPPPPPPLSESQEVAIAGASAAAPRDRSASARLAAHAMVVLGLAQMVGGWIMAFTLWGHSAPARIIIHGAVHTLLCLLFLLSALAFRHGRTRAAARTALALGVLTAFTPYLAGLAAVTSALVVLLVDTAWILPLLHAWRDLE